MGEKASLGFRARWDGNSGFHGKDSSDRVIIGKIVNTLAHSFLIGSSSYLQVTRTSIISRMSLKFDQIRQRTVEFAALEGL